MIGTDIFFFDLWATIVAFINIILFGAFFLITILCFMWVAGTIASLVILGIYLLNKSNSKNDKI